MISPQAAHLKQRAEYTHKYNANTGRHGWLRLTPAYSIRVVEDLMAQEKPHRRVLDPFCGTGTTALSAAYQGHHAVTTDINPFLVWLSRAKTRYYSPSDIAATRKACEAVCALVRGRGIEPNEAPPIQRIERWWSREALGFLCLLQAAIDGLAPAESAAGTLLRVAFCRTLIACSKAAFNHQSMSFRKEEQLCLDIVPDYPSLFAQNVAFVLEGCAQNPSGTSEVLLHDARDLSTLATAPFDLVVTSPPYANRISYVRELRPYMYWQRFLSSGRDAGELDWLAIGGTWGVATSRLLNWQPEISAWSLDQLEPVLARISDADNQNGILLANYVRKYFVDISTHLANLRNLLAPGAKLHYIIGNSSFYGQLVPVEAIYAHIMADLGFRDIQVRPIRKRNSKRELVEFDLSATWK